MGGSGSGRHGGKSTIGRTRSYVLSTQSLKEFLKLGHSGFRIVFPSDCDEILVEGLIDTAGSTPHIWVRHIVRREPRVMNSYTISLDRT